MIPQKKDIKQEKKKSPLMHTDIRSCEILNLLKTPHKTLQKYCELDFIFSFFR